MFKRFFFTSCVTLIGVLALAQDPNVDSSARTTTDSTMLLSVDADDDLDDLLNDLELFMDSLLSPRSFVQINLGAAAGYFNYTTRDNYVVAVKKKMIFSPMIGYFHKSGLGISVSSNVIRNQTRLGYRNNFYQCSITPSFDFIQNKKWTGGIYFTRHITKDSLRFYTTPLQKELGVYYLWRKSWLQPGFTVNYGWGSRTDVKHRLQEISKIILKSETTTGRNAPVTTILDTIRVIETIQTKITTRESISDLSITANVRHTFYWLDVLNHRDCFKLTPMLALSMGTQQFGFNRTTATTANIRNTANVTFNRGDVQLSETLKFQPLSLTMYLRPEYNIGKFYIQPQLLLDYYFPAGDDKFTTFFSISTGFMF